MKLMDSARANVSTKFFAADKLSGLNAQPMKTSASVIYQERRYNYAVATNFEFEKILSRR